MRDSIEALISKAYYYKNIADFSSAIASIDQANDLAEEIDNENYLIDCYNLYALLHIDFEKYNNVAIYLDIADQSLNYNKYRKGSVISKGLRALVLAEKKQYYEALKLLREAKDLLNPRDKTLLNTIAYYEGIVHYKRKDYEEAKATFEKLLPVDNSYEKDYIAGRTLLYLSKIQYQANNYEDASLEAIKALNIAKNNDFHRLIMESNQNLALIYKALNDYKKAYEHQVEVEKTKTLIFNTQALASQDKLVENHDKDFYLRLIDQLNEDATAQQQRVNISKLTSVLSSALLIIISLLTISLYRNNQIKFKTNDLLMKKNLELEIAKEEAEKAMRAKAQFLSTVSHELRTPLYAVTGLTHLLLEENPSESQKEHLKSLKFSGEYLLNFINDILQINKIEAKKLAVQNIPFNLRKVLKEVVKSLDQTAKENKNNILLHVDNDIPKELLGDPLKLSQIFINLIGNACKFTKNGEINVIAKSMASHDEKAAIHFEVKDNGIGISKEMQASIFESFAQGSIQINRKYGGTGLGLTIVRSLLNLLESDIKLDSELGRGSSFMFDMVFDIPTQEETAPVEIASDVDDAFFKNMHILLVEDNKINQVITKKMLAKKEMTCDIANDGYEAIEKAKKPIYNAILMDIHMPGISGLKATEEIRKFDKKVPIIALTAISLDENTEDFYAAGCDDVITKPFKPEVFYKKIGNNILKNIEVRIDELHS
ncbi:response regulator [Leptobacterium sp. I13]|uniref:response regulator n=1 Tax=Leptobacterium meishanense TaxID=3128904 RepID=UPI0030EDDF01